MADAPTPKPGGTGSLLTKKVAGLPGWQWAAVAAAGIGVFILLRKKSAASSTTAATTTADTTGTAGSSTGYDSGADQWANQIGPILGGQGDPSQPLPGNSTDAAQLASQAKAISTLEAQNRRQGQRLSGLEHKATPGPVKASPIKTPITKSVPKPAPKPIAKKTAPKAAPKPAAKKPAPKPAPKPVAKKVVKK